MHIFDKILKLRVILISSIFNSKVWFFLFQLEQPKLFSIILFWPQKLFFPAHSISTVCLISTIVYDPNILSAQVTGCLAPQVNPDVARLQSLSYAVASSGRPSMQESRVNPCAPSPLQNGCCLFISSPQNISIEKLHSPLAVSPPWHRLSSLLYPINGTGSLTVRRRIYSPHLFWFLVRKNSSHQSSSHQCHHSSPSCWIHRFDSRDILKPDSSTGLSTSIPISLIKSSYI
jgi:hypothetical protein